MRAPLFLEGNVMPTTDTAACPGLREFLVHKRAAVLAREAAIAAGTWSGPAALRAQPVADGRSGVRRIQIRDRQLLSDSPAGYAGVLALSTNPQTIAGSLVHAPSGGPAPRLSVDVKADDRG
ncbi:hypothetical protein ND748_11890 [Frankia sp. AiPs1]|uniref:hypothetical protein n=1 Tax=Frankia sp. AiPs1 TaxID=573493 RepID=UPI0020438DC8|nr:hypothetical protein [Frankia sp. AiPs1]MCM3922357.1 hypothetical protein [Frankia sp. AiPs1]